MDRRGVDADMVVCCTAGGVVPDGFAEMPAFKVVDIEGSAFGEEVGALVVLFCEEVAIPAVEDIEAVVVFVVVSTTKPCR
jgi:hypothetical protein